MIKIDSVEDSDLDFSNKKVSEHLLKSLNFSDKVSLFNLEVYQLDKKYKNLYDFVVIFYIFFFSVFKIIIII